MLPRFFIRMARRGGYAKHFEQRFARYDDATRGRLNAARRVWVHAVSVGEMYVALKLMQAWRARRPDVKFVLTTTTSTGRALAARSIGSEDVLLYFPLDAPFVMRRALDAIRPRAIVLVEVELWPNLVRLAHDRAIPVALVNGRVSDRSFQGYRRLAFFTRRLLPLIDVFCAQTRLDADRFAALGAPKHRIAVMGSAKYDVAEIEAGGEARARDALAQAGITPAHRILLGGSTWPGEENALLDVYKGLKTRYRKLVLVLAPRHVERADDVVRHIRDHALTFARRSTLDRDPPRGTPQVFLLDTTGELKHFYACADVIFVGKSLTQHGGQNPIEAALYGKAIVVGPNMENFRGVMDDFRAADAIVQVADLQNLRRACDELFANEQRRHALGRRAAELVEAKRGAIDATLDLLDRALEIEPPDAQ
jgi:3-deoxy-D-manno-octulosonic-acid transferase